MIAERVDQQTNPTDRVPRPRHRGHLRAHDRQGADRGRGACALLDTEDVELRKVLGGLVFAVDDETMESEVLRLCEERGWTLGVAESLTGGFIGAASPTSRARSARSAGRSRRTPPT